MRKTTGDTDEQVSCTRTYNSGGLTITVEVIGEYSQEAIDSFKRIYHETLHRIYRDKK